MANLLFKSALAQNPTRTDDALLSSEYFILSIVLLSVFAYVVTAPACIDLVTTVGQDVIQIRVRLKENPYSSAGGRHSHGCRRRSSSLRHSPNAPASARSGPHQT